MKEEILHELNKKKEEKKDMFAEVIRQSYNEGEKTGKQQNRKEMIIKMIQNNLNDALIKAISGVTDKELQNIKSSINV